MNTLRLEVRRATEAALITRDRMRVDVLAEFYVRVQPTADGIGNAAQTLGMRTMNPDALKELVEGKFVDALRAEAVRAEEIVETVRKTEIAERQKAVELVEASKEAERQAIQVKVSAEAEREAADDRAEALRTEATGEADQARITADGRAKAVALEAEAEAAAKRYEVDAEGKRALNEAHNLLSPEQIARQIKLELIRMMPAIIEQSVRPMEKIDGIKIVQVDGLTGNGGAPAASADGGAPAALSDQVVNSALRYRAQAPLVEALMKEVGLSGGDLNSLTSVLSDHGSSEGKASDS